MSELNRSDPWPMDVDPGVLEEKLRIVEEHAAFFRKAVKIATNPDVYNMAKVIDHLVRIADIVRGLDLANPDAGSLLDAKELAEALPTSERIVQGLGKAALNYVVKNPKPKEAENFFEI